MSKRANPTVIGGFVIGAILLLTGAIAFFGGTELFAKRDVYVAYFQEQTKGLRVGANVLMNGVRIGYVSDISLLVDEESFVTTTQVTMEILPDTYIQTKAGVAVGEGMDDSIDHERLVNVGGIRAQLEIESFITGLLLVELSFRPETEARLFADDPPHPEIPTMPSHVAQLLANVQSWMSEVRADFNIAELSQQFASVLHGIDELVHSQDVRELLGGMNRLVNDPQTLQLSAALHKTFSDLQLAIADASQLFANAEANLQSVTANIEPTLARLNDTLHEAEQALTAARIQLQGDSPQAYQLEATLEELEKAARAVQNFFDYLERNPEALIRGKS